MKFVLIGNPNSGKTTLFNILTGSHEHVGNWSGVTVEKKLGKLKNGMEIIDLPGVYSLSSYSQDEIVTRDFLLNETPDLIINIIDATNLERNLYLTTQLMETGLPIVIALNMIDEVKDDIDIKKLQSELNITIVPVSAAKNIGLDKLVEKIECHNLEVNHSSVLKDTPEFSYAVEILLLLNENAIANANLLMAFKLLEGDDKFPIADDLRKMTGEIGNGHDWSVIVASDRYKFIETLCASCITKKHRQTQSVTNKIDRVLLNRFLAIPIFFTIMFAVFQITFSVIGNFFSHVIDLGIEQLINWLQNVLSGHVNDLIISALTDGVIPGIGMLMTFLPQIAILFLLLSIIEDSGYMSRIAFIMDRPLRYFGLSGKAFVPMLMGFGCSVPAIMATRTLDSVRERKLAIAVTPFMSCSARMPVYAMMTAAFFPRHRGFIIFSVYFIGACVAMITAAVLNKLMLKTEAAGLIMELPPYRFPTPRNLAKHVWRKVRGFIDKAWNILLLASLVIWFMQSFDCNLNFVSDNANSILAVLGKIIAPIFKPLGFGNWQATVALLTGLVAKETVVSTLNIVGWNFSSASAYCYMIFILLYMPCLATFVTIKRELNLKSAVSIVFMQTIIAWLVAFAFSFAFGIKNFI